MSAQKCNLLEVIVNNGIKYKDHEAILVPDPVYSDKWNPVSWELFARFNIRLVGKWVKLFRHIIHSNISGKPPVVGILVPTTENSIAPYCIFASIGFTVMCIAPRDSDDAKIRVCKEGDVQLVVIEESSIDWAIKLKKQVPNVELLVLNSETECLGQYATKLQSGEALEDIRSICLPDIAFDTPAFSVACPILIMKSSGSTGIPKQIPWNTIDGIISVESGIFENSTAGQSAKLIYGLYAISASRTFLHWLVKFPETKLVISPASERKDPLRPFDLNLSIQSGQSYLPCYLLSQIIKCMIDDIWALGKNPEETVRKKKYLSFLKSFPYLMQGGGNLDRNTYIKALKLGCKIKNVLGATESGRLLQSDLEIIDEVWDSALCSELSDEMLENLYLLIPMVPSCRIHFELVDGIRIKGQEIYELVADATDPLFSSPLNANEGTNWRSKDLFRTKTVKTRSGRVVNGYLHEGRLDDVIELTSKKRILLPMIEEALHHELNIAGFDKVELVIVGKTEKNLAFLIKHSPDNFQRLHNMIPNLLVRVTENLGCEELSFLSKKIYYLSDEQQFIYTWKSTVSRVFNCQLFANEIGALYYKNDD